MIQPDDIATKGIGPLLRLIIRFIPYLFFSVRNYCRRPNLKLSLSQKNFSFEDSNKTKHDYFFPCVIIDNPSNNEYTINPSSIRINRETYSGCVSSNPIFSRCREGTKAEVKLSCLDQNNLCSFYMNNWQAVVQNTAPSLKLGAHDKLILPLFFHHNPHFIVDKFADSILWLPTTKISVRFKINSIDVEYGIKRRSVYELAINWLGFWGNNSST
ncbi:MAG: hypothetical protein ACOYJ2_01995 [Rickettsiales bacterium]